MARITCNVSAVTPLEDVMNCKEGDLAMIVKSKAGNEGKIVRCVGFIGKVKGFSREQRWRITPPQPTNCKGLIDHAPDEFLRPIRNEQGEDETLTWAGKPNAKHKKTSCK